MTQDVLSKLKKTPSEVEVCIHLVDDGSSDSTRLELAKNKKISYQRGNGDLFWAKSMKFAQDSVVEPIDYFLWLNNDVLLTDDFFQQILASLKIYPESILVGQTSDLVSGRITYGGMKRIGRHPHRLQIINAKRDFESADTFCGNIVVVPKLINDSLGGIDGTYEHGYADYDFGYRAKKLGYDIQIIPGFLGTCSLNPPDLSAKNTLQSRKILSSRKFLPIRSQIRFCKRHGGIEWPIYVIATYFRAILNVKRFRSIRISAGF